MPNQRSFLDSNFINTLTFPTAEIDAVIGFFTNRGFDKEAARSVGIKLLEQTKIDGVKVFQLLDSLKGLTSVQLTALVTEILNSQRSKTSILGYKINSSESTMESRNIII